MLIGWVLLKRENRIKLKTKVSKGYVKYELVLRHVIHVYIFTLSIKIKHISFINTVKGNGVKVMPEKVHHEAKICLYINHATFISGLKSR